MQNSKFQPSDFMYEKIKKRPVNKAKLLRRTMITAIMAVVFGLVACLTFLILEPVFSNWLNPEEKPLYVEFPEDLEEMLPGDMVVDDENLNSSDIQQEVENALVSGGQLEAALSGWVLSKDNYVQLYAAMSDYKNELEKSLVQVTGITSEKDVFNDTTYNTKEVTGVILADNGVELLILADREPIAEMDNLLVNFFNGVEVPASVKQYDSQTGLAIFAVPLEEIPEQTAARIQIATLGTSNNGDMLGTPIIAMGSPMGSTGSVGYGIVTAAKKSWPVVDATYNLLLTDIYGSKNANGVLFNYENKLVGIITNGKNESGMENMITALGISELKKSITRMSNGKPEIYMGLTGVDMSDKTRKETGIPLGVYVVDVDMDSPAMLAGIQKGDILVEINRTAITDMSGYTLALLQNEPGSNISVVVKRLVQDEYKDIAVQVVITEKAFQ